MTTEKTPQSADSPEQTQDEMIAGLQASLQARITDFTAATGKPPATFTFATATTPSAPGRPSLPVGGSPGAAGAPAGNSGPVLTDPKTTTTTTAAPVVSSTFRPVLMNEMPDVSARASAPVGRSLGGGGGGGRGGGAGGVAAFAANLAHHHHAHGHGHGGHDVGAEIAKQGQEMSDRVDQKNTAAEDSLRSGAEARLNSNAAAASAQQHESEQRQMTKAIANEKAMVSRAIARAREPVQGPSLSL